MAHDAESHDALRPHPILNADMFGAWSRDRGSTAPLPLVQYALLEYLACLPPNRVATWAELAAAMEPYHVELMDKRLIQWHVKELRHRLANPHCYRPPGGEPWPRDLILTVRGRGLYLNWSILTVTHPPRATHTEDTHDAHPT